MYIDIQGRKIRRLCIMFMWKKVWLWWNFYMLIWIVSSLTCWVDRKNSKIKYWNNPNHIIKVFEMLVYCCLIYLYICPYIVLIRLLRIQSSVSCDFVEWSEDLVLTLMQYLRTFSSVDKNVQNSPEQGFDFFSADKTLKAFDK